MKLSHCSSVIGHSIWSSSTELVPLIMISLWAAWANSNIERRVNLVECEMWVVEADESGVVCLSIFSSSRDPEGEFEDPPEPEKFFIRHFNKITLDLIFSSIQHFWLKYGGKWRYFGDLQT